MALFKKPTLLGIASGAVAGLVAITPAAGFVNIIGAIIIGIVAGIVPYFAVIRLKSKFGYDDTLDVFRIHGVAGTIGALMTGLFADPTINEAGKGAFFGNPYQFLIQLLAVAVTIVYVSIISFFVFLIIKLLLGLRVDRNDELIGLDESQHGEKAYNLHI